jgi:hypothetical protein
MTHGGDCKHLETKTDEGERSAAEGLQVPLLGPPVKRTFSLIALFAVAACGGSMMPANAMAPDGGSPCLQPTVMPLVSSPGESAASGLVEVDLGEVAAGLDPVVLASVHIRPTSGPESLSFVEGARLSVQVEPGGAGAVLAAGGVASDDGLFLSLPTGGLDLRALSHSGWLPIRLELLGKPPLGPLSVTLDVCVHKPIQHGIL